MDSSDFPSGLIIDQQLDALEKTVEFLCPKPFSYSSNRDEWIKVNHHMERTYRILGRIKYRYNTFAAIHRLPAKIILRIFQQTQWHITHEAIYPNFQSPEFHTEWLVITRVCHHWRTLALSCCSLWRNIFINPRSRHRHSLESWFMERSTPMTVHIQQNPWHNAHMLAESRFLGSLSDLHSHLSLNGDRVETLHLHISEKWQGDIVKMLNLPLPSLTNLSLISLNIEPPLPQVLCGQVSKVRRLYLEGTWCWPANVETFRGITHLVLDRISVSLSEFLNMLRVCPYLEILHMKNKWPKMGGTILPSDFAPLPTPCLKTLVMEFERSPPTKNILQYLDLSPTTSVYTKTWGKATSWLETLESIPGLHFKDYTTTLEITTRGLDALFFHQGHLVFCPGPDIKNALTFLAGHFHAITELSLETSHRYQTQHSLPWKEDDFVRFLEANTELQVIQLKTPGLKYASIVEALSKSSALFRELRVADGSDHGERVEIIDRKLLPSYQLVFEPPVPPRDIIDMLDPGLRVDRV